MKNKNIALIAICIGLSTISFAQNNTSSPYSTRGYGELESFSNAFTRSLGGSINGIRTNRSISFSNPASIGALKQVSLDFGFRGEQSKIYNAEIAKTVYNGNFSYFGLAFPVYKKLVVKDTSGGKTDSKLYREYKTIWSLGFGLTPFSNVNASYYKIQDTSYGQIGNYYSKSGGLNRVYLMNAVNITPNLSVGLNTSYLFGQVKSNESYFLFDSGISRASFVENNTQLSGFRFDFGIQGERNRDTIIRKDSVFENGRMILKTFRYPVRFVYGATLSNNSVIKYNEFRQILNRSNYYTNAAIDTILSENNINGNSNLPMSFSAGFSVTFNKYWMIAADYKSDLWSNMDRSIFKDSFTNSSQISIGIAYKPDIDISYSEVMTSGKRKARMEYRLGARMLNTGYLFKDNIGNINPLKEYGISFGIGIPKTRVTYDGRTKVLLKNMFNITGEYIRRGNTQNGMIAENIVRLTIGFTLSDIWFRQRKFY
ncbi:MAG: hypothetical protein R2852_03785 [Bacteroidia bacterium]